MIPFIKKSSAGIIFIVALVLKTKNPEASFNQNRIQSKQKYLTQGLPKRIMFAIRDN